MSYYGCFTGDCPHNKQRDCDIAIKQHCCELEGRVAKLEVAIENHRIKTGHEMCWENDRELWNVLGDKVHLDHTRPPRDEFLKRCQVYCDSRKRSSND